MRSAILFCVVLLISLSLAEEDEFKMVSETCMKELDVKTDDKGEPDKADAEKKCLAKCIGLKMGVMNEKGDILEEKLPKELKATVKQCDSEAKDEDVCKRADALYKCMMSNMKKN